MTTTQTISTIRKTIELGKVDGYGNGRKSYPVTLELEIRPIEGSRIGTNLEPIPDGTMELSICGNIWNQGRTDIISGGQNQEEIRKHFRTAKVRRIVEIWERYHLNGMKSGTSRQDEVLDSYRAEIVASGKPYHYDYSQACDILRSAGLYEDRGYRYGSAWLAEPIPTEIIEEIKTLFGVTD